MYEPGLIEEMRAVIEKAHAEMPTIYVAEDFPYSADFDFPARLVRSPFVPSGKWLVIPGHLS